MPTGHVKGNWECRQGISWQGRSSLKKKALRGTSAHWRFLGMPTGPMGIGMPTGQNGKCPWGILVAMGVNPQGVLMSTGHMGHTM